MRLGISTSCFVRLMPDEIKLPAYVDNIRGRVGKFDGRLNQLMAKFMLDIAEAISASNIESVEFYHSTAYEKEILANVIRNEINLEKWSIHAPYGRFIDPSSPDEEARLGALDAYKSAVDMADMIGAGIIVAHPGANIEYDVPRESRLNFSAKIISEVADYASQKDIMVAVEPLPKQEVGNSLDEVLWILDKADKPNIGINFDVNHLFPASKIPDLIRQAGGRIVSVHISDQDDTERHWMPFEGKIDWRETLLALKETGYAGPLIYETHLQGVKDCWEVAQKIADNYHRLIALI